MPRTPVTTYTQALPSRARQECWLPYAAVTIAFWPCVPHTYTTHLIRRTPPDVRRHYSLSDAVCCTGSPLQEE